LSFTLISPPVTAPRTAILGFGNPVRNDDAVGIYVLDQLREQLGDTDQVVLFDLGTAAFEVLFKLRGYDRFFIVDAVINSGEPVGSLFCVPGEEVEAAIQEDPMVFLHGMKWDQALSYARKILREDYPTDISVYLVAVEDTRLDQRMSAPVLAAGDRLVALLMEQLAMPA
jgi:hydrogenase maturation protease